MKTIALLPAFLLLTASFARISSATAQVRQAWVSRFSTGTNVIDAPISMAADAAGQVYVTGTTVGTNTTTRFREYLTAKFRPDGRLSWAVRYRGGTKGNNYAKALRLDSAGNCYVTGLSTTNYPESNLQVATVKYDSDGHESWVARYGVRNENYPWALTLDRAGNAYVVGHSRDTNGAAYLTIKIGATGQVQWAREYSGPNRQGIAFGVVADDLGQVFVTGQAPATNFINEMATLKYAPDGALLWVRTYGTTNPLSSETGRALALDPAGNLYVAGGGTPGFLTLKYSGSGTQLWLAQFPSQFNEWEARYIALDRGANVIIAGWANLSSELMEWGLAKYAPDGSARWTRLIHLVPGRDDYVRGLEVDEDGAIYVTGTSVTNEFGSYIFTAKYSPDGTELWRMLFKGPAESYAQAHGLALDAAGNVYVAGELITPNTDAANTADADYVVIKYEQAGPAARLRLLGFDQTGAASLSLFASSNATYTVEASTNLQHWSAIATISNHTGTIELTDPQAATFAQKFYRARQP